MAMAISLQSHAALLPASSTASDGRSQVFARTFLQSSFAKLDVLLCGMNSSLHGQKIIDPSFHVLAHPQSQKGRVATCMAWSGSLASVRLVTQGKNLELTDSIKNYVEEKVGHAVHNHTNLVREVDVRLSVRGGETGKGARLHRCEVTMFTKKHGVVRAEEEAETMYASIDLVSDVIIRKLRKIKEKDVKQHTRHVQRLGELLPSETVDLDPILARKPEDLPEEIFRVKYFEMIPMTPEQAMDQLVNVGHDFYAFRNADSGEINILYKRRHAGYGIIVPRNDEPWEKTENGTAKGKKS